ncbi:GNAT family N-acetyltransferase [Nocardioides kongjuensis]|uniref:Putative GNAT superfamily acetyltransferase n=1 Tax=Nocardioides kongjuensis TaxID=349522 RepID=A0A852RMS6_9ACTN|nr:GNAT family N-acetyltransferase [Nocardioides kongjuensis]NYD30586.1 putative GNAT superfamily acetyltransferase [Nocardioides kongjuensis]
MSASAWTDAEKAAAGAGITIRTLDDIADLEEVRRLYERIWRTGATNPPVTADLLRAMAKAGSYVSGAYDGEELVGACFGFFSAPARDALHSHIAGVSGRMAGRHVGLALKLHQRAWTLDQGAGAITWTYDPLIRRNSWFNLGKLAADVTEYLPDFYGPMDDDINRTDATDRVLVRWTLTEPAVVAACAGTPRTVEVARLRTEGAVVALEVSAAGGPIVRPAYGRTVLVGVPVDVEGLREQDPALAGAWREALREVLGGLLAGGARVRGFDRSGWYVVERQEVQ